MKHLLRWALVSAALSLSACQMLHWDSGSVSGPSRDFKLLTSTPTGKAEVLSELQAQPDNARMNAALQEILALQAGYDEAYWSDLLRSMDYPQRLHLLDVLAQERLNVVWQPASSANP